MIHKSALAFGLALALALCGCSSIRRTLPDPVSVFYRSGDPMPELSTVHRTGDFGIYFGDEKKPQIPVRVSAGEKIGFIRGGDGAIKAVAGEFRMNVSKEVESAHWSRMNYSND